MGKKAKMFKAFAAGLLALVMTFTSLAQSPVEAQAKQFTGSNFGVGFAGEEYATMHRADGWSNGGMFNCTWRAANIWFDGYLNIKIDRDKNGGYSAGEYRTNDTFGYGMYDVSFKAIKNPGVVTSFFTYTGPSDGTVWDEIDIEVLGKDTTKVQFNYYTKGQGNHEYLHNLGFDAAYGFHQYGFLWQPGRITWYVDGKAVHTATNNIPTTPGKIMMNVWPGTGVDEWLGRYNGVTPLVGSYDWINWKPVDNGSSNNNNNNNNNNWNNNNNNNNSSSGLDGIYFIKNVHSGKYLDVANGSNANNTNIQQWDRNGHNAQKFKLVSAGNGYYYLYTGASGYSKVVDVAGRSSADGANVLQYSFSGASNQQFKLQRQSDGSYAILSRVSGDRSGLDVYNWSTAAGGNVCQWNFWGGACQKWILEKTW